MKAISIGLVYGQINLMSVANQTIRKIRLIRLPRGEERPYRG